MIIFLDTNVVQALMQESHGFQTTAVQLIHKARDANHRLRLSPVAYAEAFGIPDFQQEIFDLFLNSIGIEIDWALPSVMWAMAGEAQIEHLARRRKYGLQSDKRVLPDFLIGAHALTRGAALMTFDENRYRTSYPKLVLITK